MLSLDMRTAIISYLLIAIISTFVVTLLLRQYSSRYKGVHYMLSCFALQTFALTMILLRGAVPDWISFDLSNSVSIAGIILFYIGLQEYTGQKSSLLPNLILLFVFALIHSWFTFKKPNLAIRDLNIAIVWLIIFLQCIWLLLFRIHSSLSKLTRPVTMVCIAFCIVCAGRIIRFVIAGNRPEDYFNSGWFDTSIILISQVLLILLIFSLEHMFSSHLLNDIRSEEEKFSKAFNTSSYGMAITSLSDGRIIEINKGAKRITGYSDEDVINKSTFNLWHKRYDRDKLIEEIILAGKVYEKEVQFINKNQEQITVMLSSEIITVNNEKCLLSSFDDITEKKRHVEELIKAKEKAEENDKLKTAFLHNISHEIRTPMNAITGFSALLGEPGLKHSDKISFINNIQQSCNQLLSTITDIINISNIEAGTVKVRLTELNLNSKIRSLYDRFLPKATEKNLSLSYETTLEDDKCIILTDSTKLDEILSNLIRNSLKFTECGYIKFGYDAEKSHIRFYVYDTGIGIAASQHERIFDRFYQVENSISRQFDGTGLGLSISKSYVGLLGGNIWLESQKDKGSVFYFTVPNHLPEDYKESSDKPVTDNKNTGSSEKTIIVADDNEMNYIFIRALLKGSGINILHAREGSEAVNLCKNNPDIGLVLMDIKMPGMNGLEATANIKSLRPDLPVIAQTAYALVGDHDRIIAAGCDAYISKPISGDHLVTLVNSYLKVNPVSDINFSDGILPSLKQWQNKE